MFIDAYLKQVQGLLADIRRAEEAAVATAAELLVEQIQRDRLIHVFGVSGHSVIGCEEFFWRAGGLACINPLFDLSLNLSGGGLKSTKLERMPGVGDKVIEVANSAPGDVLILTSIYGMNAATIDAALEAKRRGLRIIAITSKQHAANTPKDFVARHPDKINLSDLAEVTIDNHVPHGDCLMDAPGCSQKVGPCSTILVSFCIQWLVMCTVEKCVAAGLRPPVWQSANTPGGDTVNAEFLEKYLPRIKAL